MKLTIDRDTFAKILKKVDGVCSKSGTFAILSSCLIEASRGSITVTGTDLDITLKVFDKARVDEEGKVVLNSKRLLDTVQAQQPGSDIRLTTEGNQVLIESGNFRARIPSNDLAEFPSIPNIKTNASLTMPASTFKDLIDKTSFSISRDDSRTDFTGALLTISPNGRIQMVSTDGHRLSRIESVIDVSGELPRGLESGVIVPLKGLNEISKNLAEGDISLDLSGGKIIVASSQVAFCINLIAGQFPDFSKVIPSTLDHKATIRRDDFQQLLRRASIYTAKIGTIRLTMSRGRLEVLAFDHQHGEMRDFADCEYDGSGVTAGFNWRYIDQILSVIGCDMVSLEIIDMDSPAVVRDITTDKLDYIVMPMQL